MGPKMEYDGQIQSTFDDQNTNNNSNFTTDDFLALFKTTSLSSSSSPATIFSRTNSNSNPTVSTPSAYSTLSPMLQQLNENVVFSLTNDSLFFINNSTSNSSSSYNGTTSLYDNSSMSSASSNLTTIHFNGTYPSGYTLTHIVIASIIVTILMIIIVVGNMLVIIAIATEKSLKNIQNWFIASLAVADFFLGLIIMPFSLANELMGYWVFGSWWCDIHSAMDVLLCTASIMNLCLISLDRYWSITKAVEYLKTRTPARAAIMITSVWIMSGLICIPPLLGWKVKQKNDGEFAQCAVSLLFIFTKHNALFFF